MKRNFTKVFAVLLSLTFVLGFMAAAVPVSAAQETLTFEAESTAYKAYKTDGSELTGAAKSGVKYNGSDETADCIHFTNGDLASISYTLNVEQAGKYNLTVAYRLNWNYYAKGTISVNGMETEYTYSTKSTTANDDKDNNRVSIVAFGEVELSEGDNVITLNVTEKASDASKTQIMLDKFVLEATELYEEGTDILLRTNKTEYIEGEPVIVNAIGSGKDWVGIYTPDGTQSLYWDYVENHGSGVDFSIFVWGNKANNAPARLEAGTYIVRLMPNDQTDLSLALAEIEITIVEATADQLLSVNKTEFAVGEAINVTALGYCKDWVGIYLPGEEHSLYWEYVATVGAGKAFDITTESQKNDNVPEKLLAGNYVIRLMPNDTSDLSQALAEIEISIVNKYETETTPFVATDSNGDVIATSNEKGTWAWNLKFNKAGISGPISGELAYFRSGGIGGKIDFTVNVDNAGYYELDWAFRPHDASYCTVQFYVNGEKVGEPISQKNGDIIADEANKASVMRTVTVGGADFVAGENTITVELVAAKDDGDMTKTGFASDYFLLTPAVKPAEIVSGSNNEHKLGTEDGVDIVVSVAPEAVNQVKIGDTVLTKDTDYTVEATEEGAKISIKASALEALAAKKHTVTVATEAGEVTASVKVVNVAETGDATLALVLLAAALLTLSFCVVNKKRVSVR